MGEWDGIEHPLTGVPRMARGERVKYVPNHRSFGAFIKSEQVRKPTAEMAEAIAALAKQYSPQSRDTRRELDNMELGSRAAEALGGHMRDQFRVIKQAGFIRVNRNTRVLVEVVNDARSAALNEFGTRRNKRHRMLGRAGAMFGDFKPEGGPGGDA